MGEPVPVLPEQRPPAEPLNYRPVSGLAIAALVIAAAYSAIVSVVAVVAFSTGTPVFLGTWTLLIPGTAAVLAAIARRQIRTAEDTRSGLTLAKWAWWLSIFFGIGYGAVYVGTLVAVWWQANAYIQENFFDKIRAGKVDDAFLFTVDPEERDKAAQREEMMMRFGQATGGKKSLLVQFHESEMVQIIRQGGQEINIQSRGLKDWDYKEKGYIVHLAYRITTPLGVYDVGIGVRSRESREFKGRRWQMLWGSSNTAILSRQSKPYGDKIDNWRRSSKSFAMEWLAREQVGNSLVIFLGAKDPRERLHLQGKYEANRLAATLAASATVMAEGTRGIAATQFLPILDARLSWQLYLPGFREFDPGILVDAKEFEAPKSSKSLMLDRIKESFTRPRIVGIMPQDDNGPVERSETEPHHLFVNHNVNFAIFEDNSPTPKYQGQGALVVESDQDPMTSDVAPQWRIVGLKLYAGGPRSSGPGGMRGMGGM